MIISRSLFQKSSYVVINVLSTGVVFGRSVLFLKYLPDRELGVLMLIQAIIGISGLFQIGLFNGGLRVFSIDSYNKYYNKVNNTIVTFVIIVTILAIIGVFVFKFLININLSIILIAVLLGSLALLKNWFSNLLVAQKRYKNINVITFWASIVSAMLSLLIFKLGLLGALISIGALPFSFILLFLITNKDFRPNLLVIDIKIIKMVLVFGFIPYLSGMAGILYNQIDKFFIAGFLSLQDLGQFYLASVFMAVFTLVPNNINNLLVPDALNHYSKKELKPVYKIAKSYLLLLVAYSALVYLAVEFLGTPIVKLLFPEKLHQLHYLYILLPGLVAMTISGAFGFVLYVGLHYKAILWQNIFSLGSYIVLLIILVALNKFTLENVSYMKSLQGILMFFFLFTIYLMSRKKLNTFYYTNKVENNLKK